MSRGFYDTPEWRRLRKFVYVRDGRVCQKCGILVGPRIAKWIVDHIRPRPRGVMTILPEFDCESNLKLLCMSCHNRKTFSKKVRVGADGFPVNSDWTD